VKIFRTLSTGRLIALVVVLVLAVVAGAVAVAARGGGGSTPPPQPLAQAIHDALGAAEPAGVTARISFTNKLFPSGALTGQAGSALMTGATGRLWANATGGRLELQSDAGDAQIVWNDTKVTVYDASSNTAYVADLPQKPAGSGTTAHAAPTLDEITTFLTDLAKHLTVSGADPSNVAGQPAYTVTVSPSHDGGLLGSVQLAWDAAHGTPLKVAVYAQGSSSPVLALEATDISFGSVSGSDIAVSPPAGAKIVDLSSQTGRDRKSVV
jgi:outer membrane lipoprotein-sorting protein